LFLIIKEFIIFRKSYQSPNSWCLSMKIIGGDPAAPSSTATLLPCRAGDLPLIYRPMNIISSFTSYKILKIAKVSTPAKDVLKETYYHIQ
jgi:hypothetical protein